MTGTKTIATTTATTTSHQHQRHLKKKEKKHACTFFFCQSLQLTITEKIGKKVSKRIFNQIQRFLIVGHVMCYVGTEK